VWYLQLLARKKQEKIFNGPSAKSTAQAWDAAMASTNQNNLFSSLLNRPKGHVEKSNVAGLSEDELKTCHKLADQLTELGILKKTYPSGTSGRIHFVFTQLGHAVWEQLK
jgi:hypothetical protein